MIEEKITIMKYEKAFPGMTKKVFDEKNRIYGLQFHPESIMTVQGREMLKNFIEICK